MTRQLYLRVRARDTHGTLCPVTCALPSFVELMRECRVGQPELEHLIREAAGRLPYPPQGKDWNKLVMGEVRRLHGAPQA